MSTETHEKQQQPDISLNKLVPGLKKIIASAGWEFKLADGDAYDADLACFILGRDNLTREDEDFVFYNNLNGAQLAVRHLGDDRMAADAVDDEAIEVDFDNLSFEVSRIVFVVSLYEGHDRDQHFGKLTTLTFRIENAENNEEIHRFTLSNEKLTGAAGVRVAEIYRTGVEWFLVPAGDPIPGGLAEIARQYGMQISSTT